MKDKKQYERFLNALMTILCNYAALAGGICIFEHNFRGMIELFSSIIVILYINTLYDKE